MEGPPKKKKKRQKKEKFDHRDQDPESIDDGARDSRSTCVLSSMLDLERQLVRITPRLVAGLRLQTASQAGVTLEMWGDAAKRRIDCRNDIRCAFCCYSLERCASRALIMLSRPFSVSQFGVCLSLIAISTQPWHLALVTPTVYCTVQYPGHSYPLLNFVSRTSNRTPVPLCPLLVTRQGFFQPTARSKKGL